MPVFIILPLLETVAAAVAGTLAVRAANGLYDRVVAKK